MNVLDDLKKGVRFTVQSVERMTGINLGIALEYEVEVKVQTRLGGIPVQGVKLTVGGEDLGVSDKDGQYKDGAKAKRKKTSEPTLVITATYANAGEQLRAEQATVTLTEVDPDAGTHKASVKYEIHKVQDVVGVSDDIDFKTETDGEKEVAWAKEGDAKILKVTLKLSTLSLQVPYVNQRYKNESLQTIPGDAAGKDPEANAHDVGPFSGGVLCYPTSASMVLQYWDQDKSRKDVMQKTYERWADKSFNGRLDRGAARGDHAPTAADGGASSDYWLDTSANDPGYALYKPTFKNTKWEVVAASAAGTPKYKQTWDPGKTPGPELSAGTIWKDTSKNPPEFKKYVSREFDEWESKIAEADWRVTDSGAKIWEYGWREVDALDAFKPAGAKAPTTPAPADKYLPLTRVEADDGALPPDILKNYKDWLKSGWPFILPTTATSFGHIMVARGAVVNKDEEIEWLIVNDPYGNLAYRGTLVRPFALSGSVGVGGTNAAADVSLVKAVLAYFEIYMGEIDEHCTGKDDDALVVAIKKYQGGKAPDGKVTPGGATAKKLQSALGASDVVASYQTEERNSDKATGAESMKGKHAYYRNKTLGDGGKLRIKGEGRGYSRIQKDLSPAELAAKLTPGA